MLSEGQESGTKQQAVISKGLGTLETPAGLKSPPRVCLYPGCCGGGGSERLALGLLLNAGWMVQ